MFLLRLGRLCGVLGVFINLAVQSSYAATSNVLVNALNLDDQVENHSLVTATSKSYGSCETSSDNALADSAERSIILSNGLAEDAGFGDEDWVCSDGAGSGLPDYTQFYMDIAVPAGARSLVFRTQFFTSEYVTKSSDIKDRATLYVTVRPSNNTYTVDISDVPSVADKISPAVLRSLNVDCSTSIELSFRIEDKIDGSADSAIKLSEFYFSDEDTSGDQAEYLPEDVKLPPGTYRYSKQLLNIPGKGIPLDFSIHYNSKNSRTRYFFRKWTHSYERYMHKLEDGRLLLLAGDGGAVYFCETDVSDTYADCNSSTDTSFENTLQGFASTVVINGDGSYTYTDRSQLEHGFSTGGFLKYEKDTNGNQLALSYVYFSGPSWCTELGRNYLDRIVDTRGGTLKLHYSTDPTNACYKMLVSMEYVDRSGSQVHFLSTTYQLVEDCYNHAVLDLAYVDVAEGRTNLSYDCSGNLITVTDPDGAIVKTNTYAGERIVSSMDAKGAMESYDYIEGMIEHADRLGRVSNSYFDIQDRLIKQSNPLGESWTYTHDVSGNILSQTDPLGAVATMEYDDRGNMSSRTDVMGNRSEMIYDDHNNLTVSTCPLGNNTVYTYDSSDNLLQETDSNGNSRSYTYDGSGQKLTYTDRRGSIFRYEYSDAGDLSKEIDPLDNSVSYLYDSEGRVASMTDEKGNMTNYIYDKAGNLLGMIPPDGSSVLYTYDSQGRKLSMEKANGALTRFKYSGTGKMLEYVDPLGNVFRSDYDAEDQLIAKVDPLGGGTSFSFDLAGRLIQVVDASGGAVQASYDAAGNRTSVKDPNENTTSYGYDLLGQITFEADPLGNIFMNYYDGKGQLESFTNGRGETIKFQYDPAGRIISTEYPDYTRSSTLDANGNQIQTVGRGGSLIERVFDLMDRMVSRTDQFGNTIGYSYDSSGNLSSLTYSDGKVVQYQYDSRNRLLSVTDWNGNQTAYTYDSVGNLLETTLPDGSTVVNTYDIASQLIRISDTAGDGSTIFDAEYSYNNAGLRTSVDYHTVPLEAEIIDRDTDFIYNGANQLSQMDGQNFSYDQDGNMITGVVGAVLKSMEYDELNRLKKVGMDSYEYDSEDLRVKATIEGKAARYIYDPVAAYSHLLEEHDDAGNIIAHYVYGIGLISRQNDVGSMSVYHYDSRGSTIALTGSSGEVTDRYAYDSYGHIAGRRGTTKNRFAYNGRDGVMDDGNGLYYMRARYYEPRLMRFIQRDAAVSGNNMMDPQSLNRYAYVRGNPVQFVDPSGEILPIIIGAGVGVATEIAIDWATGEFNPLEDDWGPYLENNWVDLSLGAVLGGAGAGFNMGKKLYTVFKGSYKAAYYARKFRRWEIAVSLYDKGSDLYRLGEAFLPVATEWVDDKVEGVVDTVVDAAESVGDFFEDAWDYVF